MKQILPVPLILLLIAVQGSAAPDLASLKSQVETAPPGATIEVLLKSSAKVRGPIESYSDAYFRMKGPKRGTRQIAYDDVVSIRQVQPQVKRNLEIAAGCVVAVVLAFVLILDRHATF